MIFACSGAADVGALSDQAARTLTKEGIGKMFCLAGIGSRIPGIMKTTADASRIVAIDGCQLECVKQTLEQAGFKSFQHLQVNELGLEKGRSEVDRENTEKIVAASREKLN